MALSSLLLISVILISSNLSLSSSASTAHSETLRQAAEALSDAHFTSMALTLELVSQTSIIPQSPYLTIFAPRDTAFTRSGQPSLSLLQFHFSPFPLSHHFLRSVPYGTAIPTAMENRSLVITSFPVDQFVSLNGVKIEGPPLYADRSLTVFGIGIFFDPSFKLPSPVQGPTPDLNCSSSLKGGSHADFPGDSSLHDASRSMKSSGYSVMASLLGMQLIGFQHRNAMTTFFAPVDEAMRTYRGNISDFASIFLRHVIPCKLLLDDLAEFDKGPALPTYQKGFGLHVTKSGDTLVINNKVAIVNPEIYVNEWIVVHGVREILGTKSRAEKAGRPSSARKGDAEDNRCARTNLWVLILSFVLVSSQLR